MPYDEELAARIRAALAGEDGLTERRMFGGLSFLVTGNMAVAARNDGGMMVRVDPAEVDAVMASTGAVPVEMRGRPMRGWLHVDTADVEADDALATWVERGLACARSLPPKA